MTAEHRSPPGTLAGFVDRHREALERHADADRPASWLTQALLARADPEDQQQGADSR